MTALGWTFMCVSWGAIFLLCGFCFWKVFSTKKQNIHAPLDIDTGDSDNPDDASKPL
jgi:hypothetical protein